MQYRIALSRRRIVPPGMAKDNGVAGKVQGFGFFYIVIFVNVIILICRMKSRRALKAAAFGALLAALYALRLAGVFNVREGWFLPVALVNVLVCCGLVRVLDSWLGRGCADLRG